MAKVNIFDDNTGVRVFVSGDITINKDGSYEIGPKGGDITLAGGAFNNQPLSWSCPCEVYLGELTESIYGYFNGLKFILLNPLARVVELDINGTKQIINKKRFEIMVNPASVAKITDTATGCTKCVFPFNLIPGIPPMVKITCAKLADNQNRYTISVYNPEGLPTRVILYDARGSYVWAHNFNFSGTALFDYTEALGKGTFILPYAEETIRIPDCTVRGDGSQR